MGYLYHSTQAGVFIGEVFFQLLHQCSGNTLIQMQHLQIKCNEYQCSSWRNTAPTKRLASAPLGFNGAVAGTPSPFTGAPLGFNGAVAGAPSPFTSAPSALSAISVAGTPSPFITSSSVFFLLAC